MSENKYEDDAHTAALKLISALVDWNTSDHLTSDELIGMIKEQPPFGTPEHRLLSTIIRANFEERPGDGKDI